MSVENKLGDLSDWREGMLNTFVGYYKFHIHHDYHTNLVCIINFSRFVLYMLDQQTISMNELTNTS